MPRLPQLCVSFALGLLVVASSNATADAGDDAAAWRRLAPARAALAQNDFPHARDLMFDRVLAADVTDEELVLIARLGFHLSDRDILQELRAVLDERNKDGASAARSLAAGWAYVGLARHYIRAQKGGSSIPTLFEDALTISSQLLASEQPANIRSGASLLGARVQAAQAKRVEALAILNAVKDRAPTWAPALDGLEGRLLYDRGAAAALGADGRPTATALGDLKRGHALMDSALTAPLEMGTTKEGIESLIARRAWASHRVGDWETAEPEYGALYDRGAQGRSLALRGLASLFAHDVERHEQGLAALAKAKGADGGDAWAALTTTRLKRNALGPALLAAQDYLAWAETPASWTMHGRVLRAMRAWTEAEASYAKALALDASFRPAAVEFELMARSLLAADAPRSVEMYEHLVRLRPDDPYVRNNLGFVLRDLVTPFTTMAPGNLETIKPDAPEHVLAWLKRSVSVYAEAVALIPEEDDGQREVVDDWNLAGIVNDYALMIHYFVDVQDAAKAEALYLRTLRMTDFGFKDTYAPNMQRLYAFVLKGRELQWWRLAHQARDAVMKEQADGQGGFEIVPDEAKRASARNDCERLRAQLIDELGAEEPDKDSQQPDKDSQQPDPGPKKGSR